MIGSNIYITNRYHSGNSIQAIIGAFKTRVAADGGVFEAESCMLNTLNNIG